MNASSECIVKQRKLVQWIRVFLILFSNLIKPHQKHKDSNRIIYNGNENGLSVPFHAPFVVPKNVWDPFTP